MKVLNRREVIEVETEAHKNSFIICSHLLENPNLDFNIIRQDDGLDLHLVICSGAGKKHRLDYPKPKTLLKNWGTICMDCLKNRLGEEKVKEKLRAVSLP